jgi:hypothetical protein
MGERISFLPRGKVVLPQMFTHNPFYTVALVGTLVDFFAHHPAMAR